MFGMQVIRDRRLRLAPKRSYARYKYCGKKRGRRRSKHIGCKYTHGKQIGGEYVYGGEYTHGEQIGCKNIGSKHIRWSPRRFCSS